MLDALPMDRNKISEFCRCWKISKFAFFGSVLRDDFRPDSDLDVLVTFSPEARWSLFDVVEMRDELKRMFGREVDFVSRSGFEMSRHCLRREAILSSDKVIHVS